MITPADESRKASDAPEPQHSCPNGALSLDLMNVYTFCRDDQHRHESSATHRSSLPSVLTIVQPNNSSKSGR